MRGRGRGRDLPAGADLRSLDPRSRGVPPGRDGVPSARADRARRLASGLRLAHRPRVQDQGRAAESPDGRGPGPQRPADLPRDRPRGQPDRRLRARGPVGAARQADPSHAGPRVVAGAYDNPEFIGSNIDRLAQALRRPHRPLPGAERDRDLQLAAAWSNSGTSSGGPRRRARSGRSASPAIWRGPMLSALRELDGLDYMMLPYNFIHAKAGYSEFLPGRGREGHRADRDEAAGRRLGRRASIRGSSPRPARKCPSSSCSTSTDRAILPAAVAELLEDLGSAARRDALPGGDALRVFEAVPLLGHGRDVRRPVRGGQLRGADPLRADELRGNAALEAAKRVSLLAGPGWLPAHYQWLDDQWRV